jgi:hypothetical protein
MVSALLCHAFSTTGLSVTVQAREVWITQDAYIARMSERFGIEHSNHETISNQIILVRR